MLRMSENAHQTAYRRNRVSSVLLLAGALLVSGCSNARRIANSPNGQIIPLTAEGHNLGVGDKISEVPILRPGIGVRKTYILQPSNPSDSNPSETLAVIYDPELSQTVLNQSEPNSNESAGFLVTYASGNVNFGQVDFDTKTEVVQQIVGLHPLSDNDQPIISFFNRAHVGYEVNIDPTGDAAEQVIINFYPGQFAPTDSSMQAAIPI